jgi:uncharacterized protein (TIGR01244 family)
MKITLLSRQFSVLALAVVSIPAWASQIEAPTPTGIPNFHQVNEHIYRGGQPSDEGLQALAKLGVKTILDLRPADEHSTKAEEQIVKAAGMRYVNVPMVGVFAPSDDQVSKVLAVLDSTGPVFVHCKRGADRTGTVIACYRISHDHWQNQKAMDEAKSDGMSFLQIGMKRYVRSFRPTTESAHAAPDAGTSAAEGVSN